MWTKPHSSTQFLNNFWVFFFLSFISFLFFSNWILLFIRLYFVFFFYKFSFETYFRKYCCEQNFSCIWIVSLWNQRGGEGFTNRNILQNILWDNCCGTKLFLVLFLCVSFTVAYTFRKHSLNLRILIKWREKNSWFMATLLFFCFDLKDNQIGELFFFCSIWNNKLKSKLTVFLYIRTSDVWS